MLRHHGVSTILVESHTGMSKIPRLRLVNGRSMEIYRSLGLEPLIRENLSKLARFNQMARAESVAGQEIVRTDLEGLEESSRFSPTSHAPIDQHRLEPILYESAKKAGADLRFGTRLVSLGRHGDGVEATVSDQDGHVSRLRAKYLLACDGHRSTVRDLLGIASSGPGTLKRYATISADIAIDDLIGDRAIGAWFLANPAQGTVLLPHDRPGRWVLMVPYYDGERQNFPGITGIDDFDEATCVELVRSAVGAGDLPVSLVSLLPGGDRFVVDWDFGVSVADSFRSGRVFLLGDAAHLIPPSGGFGANVGIADAHNLAWKLGLVVGGAAHDRLLDSYERERRPVARLTAEAAVDRMDKRTSAGGADPGVAGNLAVVYGHHYRSAAVHPEEPGVPELLDPRNTGGLPGTRAPHLLVRPANGPVEMSTVDLFGRHFVLLAGSQGAAWTVAATQVSTALGLPIRTYLLGHDLHDLEDRWLSASGASEGGALLVRPDGVVGWRASGATDHPEAVLHDVMNTLLALDNAAALRNLEAS
ncbi:hypothetical protein C791_0273 [Amycolatopsis azurea DSM 43854]|nr:hypothetical protein C791_0273 [Amycolatopsis azurea DSM 43854]